MPCWIDFWHAAAERWREPFISYEDLHSTDVDHHSTQSTGLGAVIVPGRDARRHDTGDER